MRTRTVILVIGAVGLGGACLVSSCLLWALTLEDDPAGQQQDQQEQPSPAEVADVLEPAPTARAGYQCQATGMVNSCTSPGHCMYRTVAGIGSGADQGSASQMARLACQGQAIAMGGGAVCHVTCKAK